VANCQHLLLYLCPFYDKILLKGGEILQNKITVQHNGNNYFYTFEEVDECPICKRAIKPVQLFFHLNTDNPSGTEHYKTSFMYLCRACNNTFIVKYENVTLTIFSGKGFWGGNISALAPNKFVAENFNKLIHDTSPDFIKIYNEALSAETSGLEEISGIGYRKALEFLIKDFLILKNPDKKESIEKSQLGQCVTNFIDNPQLKTAASRAVWLGNDQTHYVQKFTDKDINDLKRLIRLTVHWISMILETEEAATITPIN
jgi:hypothetical protein